jgi:hypothetical protein
MPTIGQKAGHDRASAAAEAIVAGFALLALLIAQLTLSAAIHGTNYYGVDGKVAQAAILATLKFGEPFDLTNISPITGIGSQLPTQNVWANPALWPFAFFGGEMATDASTLIALAFFVTACYAMARCFQLAVLPSVVAAQLCIALFAPALLLVHTPTNFCFAPGSAVVYAPYMIALGLLIRLEPGSWSAFGLNTAGIFALVLYSLYCDALSTLLAGMSWMVAFAVVTFASFQWRTILVRCAALGSCLALLLVSGAIGYLYTLSQYTARLQFPAVFDRERGPVFVSAMTYSPYMKYIYIVSALGWLLGLLTLRGRPRVLAMAAVVSCGVYLIYSLVYLLLLDAAWAPPIPLYLEHGLLPLYMTGAVAGYWGAVRWVTLSGRQLVNMVINNAHSTPPRLAKYLPLTRYLTGNGRPPSWRAGLAMARVSIIAIIPMIVADHAWTRPRSEAEIFYLPWPNEPELEQFFADNIGLAVGRPFQGSINFFTVDSDTGMAMASLWARGIPTVNEYSQLVTAQSVYFIYKLLDKDVRGSVNHFQPFWGSSPYSEIYWKTVQMFGVRYIVDRFPLPDQFNPGLHETKQLPHRAQFGPSGVWYVYELPHPNVGDYSPTKVVTAASGADIIAAMRRPHFDFASQVVLTKPIDKPLVPARDMRLSLIRGGLHVSGKSDGTSLVLLPQQFSNCLRPRDSAVHLVRANLMMTGMVFSGDINTDIFVDYGIFSPACRFSDIAELKRLQLKIDLRMPHLSGDQLFPTWEDTVQRLHAAVMAVR